MDERPKTWDEYKDLLKKIHGKKFTLEIETFCRYTWKDAQYAQNNQNMEL